MPKSGLVVTEQVFRFSCVKLLLVFAPLAILVAISVFAYPESWSDAPPWVYGSFGCVGLFLAVACLVLPWRYFLRLTPDGLTIQYVIGRRQFSWDEVHNFRVAAGPKVGPSRSGRRVVFDLAEQSPQRTAVVRLSAGINGYDMSILATFGVSAEELASTLNEWQQRYG